ITPSCGDWDIRIHEAGGKDPGIADVMLLDDPSGFYARPPRVSTNCRLVSANGTNDPTSPPFVVGDTSLELHVQVSDPSKNAYAAIYVVDVSGNDTVIQLTYIAPNVSLTTNVVTFPDTLVGTNECTSNFVVHVGSTGNFSSIQMPPAVLKSTDASDNFTVTTNPALPANLKPGDSVVFTVCYTPPDSNMHVDSLQLVAGCVDTTVIVKGRGRTPIIYAHDWDFGNVTVGNTACKDIPVQNVGNWPLILDKNYFLHLNPDYTFNGTVPDTILPGKQQLLNFCFHPSAKGPSDSRMDWGTNLPGIYAHQRKDTTQLLGYGIAPGLSWDPHNQPFNVECTDTEIVRVHLVNISTGTQGASVSITDLHVIGDPSEFSILRTEQSPNTVPWQLPKGDSQWVDLQFAPNLNNGFGNRNAAIVANGKDNADNPYTDTLNCVAFIRQATVAINPQSYNFGDQTPGTQLTQAFTITNSGDTAFIFAGLNLTGPDFTILSGPKIGDTIHVGMTDTIVVQFTASSGGFSTGIMSAVGDHATCSFSFDTLRGSSSIVRVAENAPNYPTTFICHNDTSSIMASNTGTLPATLDSVVIVDSSAFPLASSQFSFYANGSQTIVTNMPLSPLDSTAFPVRYTPSSQGSVAAVAVFYWHAISKGKDTIFQDRQPITGIGYLASNHLSILNPTAPSPLTPYTAVTANQVSLPIQLKQPFDATAQVYGMLFTIRYYDDGFIYEAPVIPQAGFQVVNTPKPIPDPANNNYELLTIQLKSNSPIVDSGVVATVNLEYVVAKDSISPIQIKDLSFLDTNGAQACWVAEAADSTGFYGTNVCGDATLRQYLHGGMPAFSIGEVVPNPMTESANVDFFVAQDGVPMTMQVFNALGQPVQTLMSNEPHAKGGYRVSIDASQLPSGLYTIFLSSPNYGISKQVLVTK
ncbi:MAG TPA: choice-of-anchor D domain-containing protein, partial [Candidatus Kapabacteria bacterium]|nr:choice-of-anchor D domain-containing protein [Candidatus Kapabacteria bacterium]